MAEIETHEGVVFKSEDDAILLKDSEGQPWSHYLKYGRNYDSVRPPVGQKVRVHYRPWENPTSLKVSYYLNEVEVLGPPPEDGAAPQGAGPGPAPVGYQATHTAAEARVAPDGSSDFGREPSGGVEDVAALQHADRFSSPELGSWASKELSIEGQSGARRELDKRIAALTVARDALLLKAGPWDTEMTIMVALLHLADECLHWLNGEKGLSDMPPPEDLIGGGGSPPPP